MEEKNKKRYVQLHAWYVSRDGKRQFVVVDKAGNMVEEARPGGGTVSVWQTQVISLCETLNPNPINYETDKFWALVDEGKLVEYIQV